MHLKRHTEKILAMCVPLPYAYELKHRRKAQKGFYLHVHKQTAHLIGTDLEKACGQTKGVYAVTKSYRKYIHTYSQASLRIELLE